MGGTTVPAAGMLGTSASGSRAESYDYGPAESTTTMVPWRRCWDYEHGHCLYGQCCCLSHGEFGSTAVGVGMPGPSGFDLPMGFTPQETLEYGTGELEDGGEHNGVTEHRSILH